MKKMVRIKTTTQAGGEFLSPCVYIKEDAEEFIEKLRVWHHKPTYELITVTDYPKAAVYTGGFLSKIIQAERSWYAHDNSIRRQYQKDTFFGE